MMKDNESFNVIFHFIEGWGVGQPLLDMKRLVLVCVVYGFFSVFSDIEISAHY